MTAEHMSLDIWLSSHSGIKYFCHVRSSNSAGKVWTKFTKALFSSLIHLVRLFSCFSFCCQWLIIEWCT